MSNAFPEWQTEEIVEDVEDFLGGKKELPPHRCVVAAALHQKRTRRTQ